MLSMLGKGIAEGIYHSIIRYWKANNKCMKDYDINKESLCLRYLDVNYLYCWALSQKVPVDDFKWVEDLSNLYENFMNG